MAQIGKCMISLVRTKSILGHENMVMQPRVMYHNKAKSLRRYPSSQLHLRLHLRACTYDLVQLPLYNTHGICMSYSNLIVYACDTYV